MSYKMSTWTSNSSTMREAFNNTTHGECQLTNSTKVIPREDSMVSSSITIVRRKKKIMSMNRIRMRDKTRDRL
jgi:hypothetical protein